MNLVGVWRVTLPDELGEFEWRPDDVTPAEELMILTELAMGAGYDYDDWLRDVSDYRAIPVQVLVWFLRRQRGEQVDRAGLQFAHRRVEFEQVDKPGPPPESSAGSEPFTTSGPAS